MNYQEVQKILDAIPQFAAGSGIVRAKKMLEMLGHPEKKLRIIHVAGSNGKGSVCAYLCEILKQNGYRVGLFTSPHLYDMRERIRINDTMIDETTFAQLFKQLYDLSAVNRQNGLQLAYFDYFLGIALLWYAQQQADVVILETGLGGRLDATNAIEQPILSVLTTISLEHTAILGDTLEAIAAEKAGIIKMGVPVVYTAKETAVTEAVLVQAEKVHAGEVVPVLPKSYQIQKNMVNRIDFSIYNEYYKNDCFSIATNAVYQVENVVLALTAAAVLSKCGQVVLQHERIKQAVYCMHWAGRMDKIADKLYVDGAHNPEGIAGFIRSVAGICKEKKGILLFSVVKDKNFETMIQMLTKSALFSCYIIVELQSARHLDGDSIKSLFEKYDAAPVYEFDTVADGFAFARNMRKPEETLFCTGSLYLVGEITAVLRKEKE